MCAANQCRIAIIGAGIGGLTLAIALRRYGVAADIFEQTAELREVGAAVAREILSWRQNDGWVVSPFPAYSEPPFPGRCAIGRARQF